MAIYKDKKSGKWFFRVYVYDPIKEKRLQKTRKGFDLKKEAVEAEAVFLVDFEKNKYNFRSVTFNVIYEQFKNHTRNRVKSSTAHSVISRMDKHIYPHFKDFNIINISQIKINQWYDYMRDLNLTSNYKNTIIYYLIQFFNFAEKSYGITNRYVHLLPKFKNSLKDVKKEKSIYTIDEFNHLIKYANEFEKVLLTTLFFTGVRSGELRGLQWQDYDYQESSITIKRAVYSRVKGEGSQLVTPKSRAALRIIPIPERLNQILCDWKKSRSNAIGFNDNYFIFGDLRPTAETTIRRWINELIIKSKLHHITIHEFRHSYATLLYNQGMPVEISSKLLGHSSISVTMDVYTKISKSDISREIKERLNF